MDDNVLIEAANDTWELPRFSKPLGVQEPRNRAMQLRKAKSKLRKPDVRARIAEIYQDQGFDLVDALQMHVQHIRGTERIVKDDDGDVVLHPKTGEPIIVGEKPNYQALKDYLGMVLPKSPTQIRVDQRSVNVSGTPADFDRSSTPAMSPRVLGKAVVEK
jgi:hypothetical protein